jgi:hypothetical protein
MVAHGIVRPEDSRVKRIWRDYGLSITLILLFVGSWALQTWMGWVEFVSEQQAHGQAAEMFGPDGYFWNWGQSTFENWQSEFLQVFVFVVLTTFLVHRKSHESPDTDYDTEAALRRIEAQLKLMQRDQAAGDSAQESKAAAEPAPRTERKERAKA